MAVGVGLVFGIKAGVAFAVGDSVGVALAVGDKVGLTVGFIVALAVALIEVTGVGLPFGDSVV